MSEASQSGVKNVVHRLDTGLLKIEEFILSYGIILLAILVIGNVISRVVFNYSWTFVEEISQAVVVFVTFLGLGYCTRKARHIRMSAVYDLLSPRVRKVIIIIVSAGTAGMMLLLTYWSAQYAWKVKMTGNVTPSLRVPMYLIVLWVPFGFLIAAIEYILTIYKNLKEPDVYLSVEMPDTYEEEISGTDHNSEEKEEKLC